MQRHAYFLVSLFLISLLVPLVQPAEAASGSGSWRDGDTASYTNGQTTTSSIWTDYPNQGLVISQGTAAGSATWELPVGVSSSKYDCVDTQLEYVYNTDGYSGGDLYFYKWGGPGWSYANSISSSSSTSTATSSWVSGNTVDSSGKVTVEVDVAAGEEFDVKELRIKWRDKTSSTSPISNIYPSVQVNSPSNTNSWIGSGVSASFSTSAACGADTWYYRFSTGSSAPSSGYFSTTSSSINQEPTLCGRNYLHVYFEDKAGRNSGKWSSSSHVISFDECAPTASLNNPGSQWYTSVPTLSWSGSDAHAGLASSPFTIQVNGNTVGTYSSSTTSLSASSYSNRLTCGSNTIKLTVKDAASPQNSDSDSETLNFDNCAPTSPGAPNLNTNWVNEDGKPTITWSASTDQGSGIARYDINLGSGWVSTGTSTSYTPSTSLSTGTHTIQIRAVDNAGNPSGVSQGTLRIDTTGPSISSVTSSSHSSSIWSNSNSVQVSSSATDTHAGMDAVYFLLSSQSSGVSDSTILSANNKYSCSGGSSCSASYTLTAPSGSSGTYYAYALARDDAVTMSGNPDPNYANSIRSAALLIDLVAPTMTSAPSVQNLVNGYHGNGAVSINLGTASDQSPGSGVASFRYYVKDVSSSTTPAYQTISA
ncbi:MAG: Ig-like domain-containing protein, partial [Candidatus Poseidoniaceae archaeon]|nr:Ig-like domain-containing protein [Candidatus Poseidoniaceae archaeon]